ncbi:hypothetical protein H1C71_004058 [Ictidomys tridecemlineatus]|nr:hypothetical protein H1C71_004058 [Ictidomys tridecemlineatus]
MLSALLPLWICAHRPLSFFPPEEPSPSLPAPSEPTGLPGPLGLLPFSEPLGTSVSPPGEGVPSGLSSGEHLCQPEKLPQRPGLADEGLMGGGQMVLTPLQPDKTAEISLVPRISALEDRASPTAFEWCLLSFKGQKTPVDVHRLDRDNCCRGHGTPLASQNILTCLLHFLDFIKKCILPSESFCLFGSLCVGARRFLEEYPIHYFSKLLS